MKESRIRCRVGSLHAPSFKTINISVLPKYYIDREKELTFGSNVTYTSNCTPNSDV